MVQPVRESRAGREPLPRMTYEEFLEWADEDTWAEWVDGEVVILSPANLLHQNIKTFLVALMRIYTEEHGLGTVVDAPFQMRLRQVKRGREPDILFVGKDRLPLLTTTYLDGPADLVVEIISPDSTLRDRGEKFAEYEIEGVREYWLIDPQERRVDFLVLGEDRRYQRHHPDAAGVYRSTAIQGFQLKVDWLWQDPPPRLLEVLREWGMV